jgi:hypothetical protein
MTTAAQQTIIAETARELGVSPESVADLFALIDRLREQHGEQWRERLPGELIRPAVDGELLATEILRSMAYMIESVLSRRG